MSGNGKTKGRTIDNLKFRTSVKLFDSRKWRNPVCFNEKGDSRGKNIILIGPVLDNVSFPSFNVLSVYATMSIAYYFDFEVLLLLLYGSFRKNAF